MGQGVADPIIWGCGYATVSPIMEILMANHLL